MSWRDWFGRRGGDAQPVEAWDALIDLDQVDLPIGVPPEIAGPAVARVVRRLPGAGWVDVQVHRAPNAGAVRLFPAGSGEPLHGERWAGLRERVASVAREALARLQPPPSPGPVRGFAEASPQFGTPPGLADSMSLLQADALAELAALAASTRAEPAPPPAGPAPDDTDRAERLLRLVLPIDCRDLATLAVERFGSFAALLAAPEGELRQIPGLGTHSIAALKLVHAAALRVAQARLAERPVLDGRAKLFAYLSAVLSRERVEQFRILFLDAGGMLKADEVQGTGTVNHTPVYPREVVRRALELGATSVVLVHNHPSGDPTPSSEDLSMTEAVQDAAAAVALDVTDHIIVGNGRWVSFRDEGLL